MKCSICEREIIDLELVYLGRYCAECYIECYDEWVEINKDNMKEEN